MMHRTPRTVCHRLALAGTTLLLGAALAVACLRPPEGGPEGPEGETANAEDEVVEAAGFYGPTWADSGGISGKGGVKLVVNGEKRLPLVKSDFDKSKRGDKVTQDKKEWQLFYGPGDLSLGIQFKWITKENDKFFSNVWARTGMAFNESWAAIDATKAKYLVLWLKTSHPGVDLELNFHSVTKSKGQEDTGPVPVSDYIPGGQLDESWRRVVVPISDFPEIDRVDMNTVQQVMFTLKGGTYPENEPVAVFVDNVYITDIDMVTPVSNAGYLVREDGVQLEWSKNPGEKIKHFSITVDGREAVKAKADARSALVPRSAFKGSGKAKVAIATVGSQETSDPTVLTLNPKPAPAKPAKVTLGKPAHDISPHIFGINWGPTSAVKDIGATGRRWGGNRTTKYNWKYDVDSAGRDWYFLNDYSKPAGTPERDKKWYQFVKETKAGGAVVNFCIPISEWIAKPYPDKEGRYCSYPVSKYPKQEATDGQGCGNGRTPDGKPIWGNDPDWAMTKNSPELQREFVQTAVKEFGPASKGGIEFYSMDNEPGLWMHTHRDTVPKGISAETLAELNIQYAKVVKDADPSAQVIGFGAWGVKSLAGSNLDFMKPGPDAYKQDEDWTWRERNQHGDKSQLVYMLERFKAAERQYGKRLVDVVDIHWYPELYGKTTKGETKRVLDDLPYDAKFSALQFEALREFWDPTFDVVGDEKGGKLWSWTANGDAKAKLWDPYHPVIPALKGILEKYYPGTKLAINEYDNGSPEHYHGALLRAAAYGIFMQEDLFMAENWHQTDAKKFTYWAQKLYGNYDDRGSRVQGKFVPAQSTHPDLYSFAATHQGKWTVILVNRNPKQRIAAAITLPVAATKVRTFTLAETLGLRILAGAATANGKTVSITVPAYAAMLVTTG